MVFDVLVLITLLVSALIAFLRGVIREILTILGVVGGLAAAYYLGPLLVPHMDGWLGVHDVAEGEAPQKLLGVLPYDLLSQILSYGLVFVVVVIILSIFSHLIAETVRAIGLGPVDRTLGVIFGLARGVILLGIIYLPFHIVLGDEEKQQWFEGSKTFFYVEQVSKAMIDMVPDSMMEKFKEDAEKVKDTNETREKLQSLDLLKKDNAPQDAAPVDDKKGYTDEFRDQMDKLFENKPGTGQPAPQPAPAQQGHTND